MHLVQFTVKVSAMLWVSVADPDVTFAITVRLYVPAGVPRCGAPLPPVHEVSAPVAIIATKNSVTNPSRAGCSPRRRRNRAKVALASSAASASHQTGTLGNTIGGGRWRGTAIPRAVVLTFTVVFMVLVPLRESDEGVIVHTERLGAPVQVRATVPVKPEVPLNARL